MSALAAALVAGACTSRESAPASDARGDSSAAFTPATDTASGGGMADMPGMGPMAGTESARMIAQMRSGLRALDGANADSLRRALPAHRRSLANLIAEMNREMRGMNMSGDAAWAATVDSLRQDLARMPDLGGAELAAMMPAHRARAERLMDAHRQMMGGGR